MTLEDIRTDIIEMRPRYNSFTLKDKQNLKLFVKELNIDHKFRNCSNCYRDAFHLIMNKLSIKSADFVEKTNEESKYIFIGKKEATWYGPYGAVTLNEFTPDKMIDKLIEATLGTQNYYILKPVKKEEQYEPQLLLE